MNWTLIIFVVAVTFTFLPSSSLNIATPIARREVFTCATAASVAFITASTAPSFTSAAESAPGGLETYSDKDYAFSLKYPASWVATRQELADRRVLELFVDPSASDTSVFVAYTPVRDDYTSLSSFGSLDQVAQTSILPKGTLAGSDVDSKMLSSESKNSAYYFDYVVALPDQPERHLQSIFALLPPASGSAGMTLVTITAQCLESDYPKRQGEIKSIIESYAKEKK
ncbi:hypothetical protein TrVE_jg8480 [Triparma verrucosa]|uniref:PsbP C-terminal domain-containing protein n=1 Tax=Triparma verrucosa TaxID=1606542 RepID=A0A9W7BTA7_9STRA|nr:hypothetical protein TrVE_jg8480 [Triparma verrucosa]